MTSLVKPLLRPLPLLGVSTGGLILAASLSSTSKTASMASNHKRDWPVQQYTPRHTSWPYNPSDFTRQDNSRDAGFYSSPRFVTHIDDAAIATLREYYNSVLPRRGRILDFCSSWVSHYPKSIEEACDSGNLKITGLGMNKAELDANNFFNNGRVLADLNDKPDVSAALATGTSESEKLDASTCVVSIDYLTSPVEVLRTLLSATKSGGTVHLTISNRCFPTKAVSRWLRVSEQERLQMVGDFLHFAGWEKIEIVELSNGRVEQDEQNPPEQGSLQSFMSMMGMGGRDPLWVVRAVKGGT